MVEFAGHHLIDTQAGGNPCESFTMQKYHIDGLEFTAASIIGGVLIEPQLPDGFWSTTRRLRPLSHADWLYRPFVITVTVEALDTRFDRQILFGDEAAVKEGQLWMAVNRQKWLSEWPGGVCYEVYCLDKNAIKKPSLWGKFKTLSDAVNCAVRNE